MWLCSWGAWEAFQHCLSQRTFPSKSTNRAGRRYTLCSTATVEPPLKPNSKKGLVHSKINLKDLFWLCIYLLPLLATRNQLGQTEPMSCSYISGRAQFGFPVLNLVVLCVLSSSFLQITLFTFRNRFISQECGLYFLLTMSLPLLQLLLPYAHGSFEVLPGFVTLAICHYIQLRFYATCSTHINKSVVNAWSR